VRTQILELEGDITKVEAFENWKFFQVSEERVQAQRKQQ
jgi:hypothetical protein